MEAVEIVLATMIFVVNRRHGSINNRRLRTSSNSSCYSNDESSPPRVPSGAAGLAGGARFNNTTRTDAVCACSRGGCGWVGGPGRQPRAGSKALGGGAVAT